MCIMNNIKYNIYILMYNLLFVSSYTKIPASESQILVSEYQIPQGSIASIPDSAHSQRAALHGQTEEQSVAHSSKRIKNQESIQIKSLRNNDSYQSK